MFKLHFDQILNYFKKSNFKVVSNKKTTLKLTFNEKIINRIKKIFNTYDGNSYWEALKGHSPYIEEKFYKHLSDLIISCLLDNAYITESNERDDEYVIDFIIQRIVWKWLCLTMKDYEDDIYDSFNEEDFLGEMESLRNKITKYLIVHTNYAEKTTNILKNYNKFNKTGEKHGKNKRCF